MPQRRPVRKNRAYVKGLENEVTTMPKLKTNRGAAKRFRKRAGGSFKRRQAFRNHILTKKSPKRKRQLRSPSDVAEADTKAVTRLLPYS